MDLHLNLLSAKKPNLQKKGKVEPCNLDDFYGSGSAARACLLEVPKMGFMLW